MVAAHLRAVLSDPGTVPLPKTSLDFSDMHSGQKMSKVYCTLCIVILSKFDVFICNNVAVGSQMITGRNTT